ncbi:hypothetical protein SFA35_15105 [Pseudomonas sp. HR96]|uniref:hypothetical protein n=1 Tax=Pseudomonas sp. HR96 TaxID=1027966 RepID=UPI002A74AFBB|nr:hypothetical protein [Pseudomonas sp. HR96]WPO97977.1 hypothetical protein SFA35_15105 [Pseudomonas sp. HR96]
MNENSPFNRTVVFVDGYSAREVLLDEHGLAVPSVVESVQVPVELLAAAALKVGDNDLTAFSATAS